MILSLGWFIGCGKLRFGCSGFARFFDSGNGFGLSGFGLLLFEAIYRTGSVNQVLLTGIERMALAADFRVESFFGGSGLPGVTACAGYGCCCKICWVDTVLHREVLNSAYSIADSCFFRQGMVK